MLEIISLGWIDIFGAKPSVRNSYIKLHYESLVINKILVKHIPGAFIPMARWCIYHDSVLLDLKNNRLA